MSVVFRPRGNRVLIQRDAPKTETSGGLQLPTQAQTPELRGVVIRVGDGSKVQDLKQGMVVHFQDFAGMSVGDEKQRLHLIPDEGILVIEEEGDV